MKQPKSGDLFLKSLLPLLGSFLGSFLSCRLFRKLPRNLLGDYSGNFLDLCLQSSIDDGLDNQSWICHVRDNYKQVIWPPVNLADMRWKVFTNVG